MIWSAGRRTLSSEQYDLSGNVVIWSRWPLYLWESIAHGMSTKGIRHRSPVHHLMMVSARRCSIHPPSIHQTALLWGWGPPWLQSPGGSPPSFPMDCVDFSLGLCICSSALNTARGYMTRPNTSETHVRHRRRGTHLFLFIYFYIPQFSFSYALLYFF